MDILIYFIACVLIALTGITIINVLTFPRLKKTKVSSKSPFVSILIPARNEAKIIDKTIANLLEQEYPNFEIIILNDNSTDNTGEILNSFTDKRLKVINGKSLPSAWMGKSWACHQLSQHAKGEILVFTDADVQWTPNALNSTIDHMQSYNADLFTVWSTQQTMTLAERLVVPLMSFAIFTYLPTFMTHYSPFSIFAAANGQCMVWKRSIYEAIGGHHVVAQTVLDDVNFARHIKKHNYKLRMADANHFITCRMYDDWESVRDGFSKNILAGYGDSVVALAMSIIFHFIVFLLPFIILIAYPEYRFWVGLFIIQSILIRALSASFTHQRRMDAVGLPISVILMTIIAVRSIYWHYTGGVRWKGRTIANAIQESQHHV